MFLAFHSAHLSGILILEGAHGEREILELLGDFTEEISRSLHLQRINQVIGLFEHSSALVALLCLA
jgi:hypothetical protein